MTPKERKFMDALNDRRYVVIVRKENWVWDPARITFEVKTKRLTRREAEEYVDLNEDKRRGPSGNEYFIADHKLKNKPEAAYGEHLIDKWMPIINIHNISDINDQ